MSKKIKTFDILLALIPVLFVITSTAVIYGLVFGTNNVNLGLRQGVFALIGIAAMLAGSLADYRLFRGTSWVFYLVGLTLLVLVEIFGKTVNGAKNWIELGFFQLQPSEVMKAFIILYLSAFFSNRIEKLRFLDIAVSFIILALPLALIFKEPDFGTALVIIFIYLVLFFLAKPGKVYKFAVVTTVLVSSCILILSAMQIRPFDKILKEYQRDRILVFLSPSSDPRGSGYNVRQAQIAVGSGGILGRGLGHGSQSQLQFLPEPHTDFIFAGIAESFGFLGSAIFLVLYLLLILKILNISNLSQDNFGMFVTFGVSAMLVFQVLINVGMNLGLAPVTGIPLPLLSSGGTSLIVTMFLLGVVQSIFMRHKKLSF